MFSCEFCEISKNTFFTEHLQETVSYILWNLMSSILDLLKMAVKMNYIWAKFVEGKTENIFISVF